MEHSAPRYPLDEGFELLRLPRSSGYLRIQRGMLRIQKDGRRSYITAAEIDRYVAARDRDLRDIGDEPIPAEAP